MVNILSVHDWLFDYCVESREPWEVHSIYRQTVCLSAPDHLVTFSTKGNGPATVFYEKPLPEFRVGQTFFPQALVGERGHPLWVPPKFSIGKKALESFNRGKQEVSKYTKTSSLLTKSYFAKFKLGVKLLGVYFPGVRAGAEALIGLGPGLTPSGDDFLTGYCHVLYHSGITDLWSQLSDISHQTNRVSKEMLWWACRGTVISYWEDALQRAIGSSDLVDNDSFENALSIGSSSGADYMLGSYIGLSFLAKTWL